MQMLAEIICDDDANRGIKSNDRGGEISQSARSARSARSAHQAAKTGRAVRTHGLSNQVSRFFHGRISLCNDEIWNT